MLAAQTERFNVVFAEALDRFSQDQEVIVGVFKHLSIASLRMVTLSEGDINELHIGFKATMIALHLKEFADKTRCLIRHARDRESDSCGLIHV